MCCLCMRRELVVPLVVVLICIASVDTVTESLSISISMKVYNGSPWNR
jgi:hypothetical protein